MATRLESLEKLLCVMNAQSEAHFFLVRECTRREFMDELSDYINNYIFPQKVFFSWKAKDNRKTLIFEWVITWVCVLFDSHVEKQLLWRSQMADAMQERNKI